MDSHGPRMQPRPSSRFSLEDLPPNIFSIVMATGIVSLAALGSGWRIVAWALFALNLGLYGILSVGVVMRLWAHPARAIADSTSHAKAPGYFTLVAGTCVLGNQCVLLGGLPAAGLVLWGLGLALWCLLTYTILPALMTAEPKPPLETAISGVWLLAVVGTQAVSVLGSILAPTLEENASGLILFTSLGFWLVGSMLYVWLISLIFYRIVFLPLSPTELAPPYWINMGAMAISTLAGLWLIRAVERLPLLGELLPYLKGMTLLFWSTATWWIPLLLALGVWRHIRRQVPLAYDHGYWAAVFPLGMYTVCTQRLSDQMQLRFLEPLASAFAILSLVAWSATFGGLLLALARTPGGDRLVSRSTAIPTPNDPEGRS